MADDTKKYTTYTLPADQILEFGPESIIHRDERPNTRGQGSYPEELSFRGGKIEGRPVILNLSRNSGMSWDSWLETTQEHEATCARIRVLAGTEVRSYEHFDTVELTIGTWRFAAKNVELDIVREWDDV